MRYLNRSTILFILVILTCFCSKNREKITYKTITIKHNVCQLVCRDVFFVSFPVKFQNKVFFKSSSEVWVADMDKKEAELLFKKGMGPNEVYLPYRLVRYNNEIYINSFMPLKHVFHFSTDSMNLNLQQLEIPTANRIDDFLFLSPDKLVITFVDWDEGDLVRIYDLKTGKYQSMGERTFSPIMRKFNVNAASMCSLENCIYVIQTIVPEIQVISIPERKVIDKIKLSPPFYKPMPVEYNVKKFDKKKHQAWLGFWTALFDISGKDGWLLVTYKIWVGEEIRYNYELINLKDRTHRFFIDAIPSLVYDFEISGDKVSLDMCQGKEDGVIWQKADMSLR